MSYRTTIKLLEDLVNDWAVTPAEGDCGEYVSVSDIKELIKKFSDKIDVGDLVKVGESPFWHTIDGEVDDYYCFSRVGLVGQVVMVDIDGHLEGDVLVQFEDGTDYFDPSCVTTYEGPTQ